MVQNIHICPVGFSAEPILNAVGAPEPADKYYFLYNNNKRCIETLHKVEGVLRELGQGDIVRVEIDAFDYSSAVTEIMRIHHQEMRNDSQSRFFINITSGTNIVAGACCGASYFIGATLYYVVKEEYAPGVNRTERIKIIRTPKIPDIEKMKKITRDILKEICSKEGVTVPELSERFYSSQQKLNHHIRNLVENGLIIKDIRSRPMVLRGTDQGKMLCDWFEG